MMDEDELRSHLRGAGEPMPAATRAAIRDTVESALRGVPTATLTRAERRRNPVVLAVAAAAVVVIAVAVTGVVLIGDDGDRKLVETNPPDTTAPPTSAAAEPSTTATAVPASTAPVVSEGPPVTEPAVTTTTTTTPPAPANVALPPDFTIQSMSFTSSTDGWIMGWPKDALGPPSVIHTTDGGRSWQAADPPGLPVQEWAQLLFADATNGWLLGDQLYSTHDAGATWTEVPLGDPNTDLEGSAVGTAGGQVYVSKWIQDGFHVFSSPVESDAFGMSPLGVTPGAGPAPRARVALDGSTGLFIINNRYFVGGARLDAGEWVPWDAPCSFDYPWVDASAAGETIAVVCAASGFAGPPGQLSVSLSHDGGRTFTDAVPVPGADQPDGGGPLPQLRFVFTADDGALQVGYTRVDGAAVIVRSGDGGATWVETYRFPADNCCSGAASPAEIPGVGVVVVTGPGTGLLTRDNGLTWEPLG